MDVWGARVPEATPSPGRTSRAPRYPGTPTPGLARPHPGWRTHLLPSPDIAIATHASPCASDLPTSPTGPPDTRRHGRQPPRPCLASLGPARGRPGWPTHVLPEPDIAIMTGAVLHPAPALRRPPLLGPQILGDVDAGIARPHPVSPALACLARIGGRVSCLPQTSPSRPARSLKLRQRQAGRHPPYHRARSGRHDF